MKKEHLIGAAVGIAAYIAFQRFFGGSAAAKFNFSSWQTGSL